MSTISNLKPRIDIGLTENTEFQVYTERQLDRLPPLRKLSQAQRFDMRVVANVLPFRVNHYVIDELIDWDNIPDDPVFQLTFPQKGMLTESHYALMADAVASEDKQRIRQTAVSIRQQLNPHPAGQQLLNVPRIGEEVMQGMQHKYRETLLFFPSQGQVCHSYCSFCFRWAQFVGDKELRFAAKEADQLHRYLIAHPAISDLLMTGGDPMVMKASHLAAYLEPLLDRRFEQLQTIRIGTKSLTFWPQRYVTDPDADDILRLLEKLVLAGKHVAIMAHYNHWREMETGIAREAVRRLRSTGAVIRTQAPLLRHINDDPAVWARMWRTQVRLGMTPYYMFVERDTGARQYFELPLGQAWSIYRDAMQQVSGLGRTARGPSMSAGPGKVEIQGVTDVAGERAFVLRFIQARNPDWVQRPFFAKYDPAANWLDQLQPLSGEKAFFFEDEYRQMLAPD